MHNIKLRQTTPYTSTYNLINNPKMFNGVTDDLAAKPYIPQKNDFNKIVANVLHGNIGIVNFGLQGYGGC